MKWKADGSFEEKSKTDEGTYFYGTRASPAPPPCRELPTADSAPLAPNVSFVRAAGIGTWTRWLSGLNRTQPLALHLTHVPKAGGSSLKRNLYCLLDCSHIDAGRNVQQAFALCNLTSHMVIRNFVPNNGRCARGVAYLHNNGHVPRLEHLDMANVLGVVMLREPVARLRSAYAYRDHNPNMDNYGALMHVPKNLTANKKFFTFEDMVGMPPYANIAVQMLGTGKHPYRQDGMALGDADLDRAEQALRKHVVVGLTEAPASSWLLMTRFLGLCDGAPAVLRDFTALNRHSSGATRKAAAKMPRRLLDKARSANVLDMHLYRAAVRILCGRLSAAGLTDHPEVRRELYGDSPVNCGRVLKTSQSLQRLSPPALSSTSDKRAPLRRRRQRRRRGRTRTW